MNGVFADTSFYIALLNPADDLHASAEALALNSHSKVVTTEYVLIETGNWLARSSDRAAFLNLIGEIRRDPATRVVWASRALFDRGYELYARREDKDWSLTDCISFEVMRENNLGEALTADRHFEQAGFRALLNT